MSNANVDINEEVKAKSQSGWVLAFQYCTYNYDDGSTQNGYRFIWYRPDGTLQAARGQARIPSMRSALMLIGEAVRKGWAFKNVENDTLTLLFKDE